MIPQQNASAQPRARAWADRFPKNFQGICPVFGCATFLLVGDVNSSATRRLQEDRHAETSPLTRQGSFGLLSRPGWVKRVNHVSAADSRGKRWLNNAAGAPVTRRILFGACLGAQGEYAMRMRLLIVILFGIAPHLSAGDNPAGTEGSERIERLIRQLGSGSFQERERAGREIIAIGAAALPRLRSATENADREIARRAKSCIEEIEIDQKVAELVNELKSPDAKVRWAAANTIMLEMRSLAKGAVPALIQALEDNDNSVRLQAARALKMVGPGASAAVPRLTQLLSDRKADVDLRWTAAMALSFIGKGAESAVPDLLHMLEEKDPILRNGAANSLGLLGRNHKDVVPALIRALNTKDVTALAAAAGALADLGKEPERCVAAVLNALKGAEPGEGAYAPRRCLVNALGRFGTAARTAIPTIAEIAGNDAEDRGTRRRAILALEAVRKGGGFHKSLGCEHKNTPAT